MSEMREIGRCLNCGNVSIQQNRNKILDCRYCDTNGFSIRCNSVGFKGTCTKFSVEIPVAQTWRGLFPQITNGRSQKFLVAFWLKEAQISSQEWDLFVRNYRWEYSSRKWANEKEVDKLVNDNAGAYAKRSKREK